MTDFRMPNNCKLTMTLPKMNAEVGEGYKLRIGRNRVTRAITWVEITVHRNTDSVPAPGKRMPDEIIV